MRTLRICLQATLVTLLLTGIVYPLAMTGMARLLFPAPGAAAAWSRTARGRVVGSELIGQAFTKPGLLPGAALGRGAAATTPPSSSGSNLGPTSAKLRDRVQADVERLRKENPDAPLPIPAELVTASGSGLDPHLSPGRGALAGAAGGARARRAPRSGCGGWWTT